MAAENYLQILQKKKNDDFIQVVNNKDQCDIMTSSMNDKETNSYHISQLSKDEKDFKDLHNSSSSNSNENKSVHEEVEDDDDNLNSNNIFDTMEIEIEAEYEEEEDSEIDEDEGEDNEIMKYAVSNFSERVGSRKSNRLSQKSTFCQKKYEAKIIKKLTAIIKKDQKQLSQEDELMIQNFPNLMTEAQKRLNRRSLASERLKEIEEPLEVLELKCIELAKVIEKSKYLVVYSGAGISTEAGVPDYRGPNGIWTRLNKGETIDNDSPTILTLADPTKTHMSLKELFSRGILKHTVSQNCDGLHLRSGIPKVNLSEVHGNMYIEVCSNQKCAREYVRNFDVTEKSRRFEHRTGRNCYFCSSPLKDTIVHFGERGKLRWPLNWAGAEYNVDKADVIVCLGSSLKVLRRYPWLWSLDKPVQKRPKLFIVNLQWTPKDSNAIMKIQGKCDDVMIKIMKHLNIPIPEYKRETDTIFDIATPLHLSEISTKSSRELEFYKIKEEEEEEKKPCLIKIETAVSEDEPLDLTCKNKLNNYMKLEPIFRFKIEALTPEGPEVKVKEEDSEENPENEKKVKKIRTVKANGTGWLGNAWGVKAKKKKLK